MAVRRRKKSRGKAGSARKTSRPTRRRTARRASTTRRGGAQTVRIVIDNRGQVSPTHPGMKKAKSRTVL